MTPAVDGRERGRSPIVIAVAVLGVAVFVAVFVARAVFHASIDPTESTVVVTLRNDTTSPVLVSRCAASCTSFDQRDRLLPGASLRVSTAGDATEWWAVSDVVGGVPVGCLPLRNRNRVDVSAGTACPSVTGGGTSLAGTLLGFGLFLAVAGIGLASIVFATQASHRWIARRGLRGGAAATLTTLAGVAMFLGGWLFFDFYVLFREGRRPRRRTASRA